MELRDCSKGYKIGRALAVVIAVRFLTAPSLETVAALAAALHVAPAVLFGAEPMGISGERRETLERINKLLASGSDAELKRAERVLGALLRG